MTVRRDSDDAVEGIGPGEPLSPDRFDVVLHGDAEVRERFDPDGVSLLAFIVDGDLLPPLVGGIDEDRARQLVLGFIMRLFTTSRRLLVGFLLLQAYRKILIE